MSRYADRLQHEYDRGVADGVAAEKHRQASAPSRAAVLTSQLELMKAVTQLLSVGGQTVQSLAQVFDNGPRS